MFSNLKKKTLFFDHCSKRMTTSSKLMSNNEYDIVIIGGGIIGTAMAKIFQQRIKRARIALLEKENDTAQHQSSHNSNVIHAGIYYPPNSLKAKLCVKGAKLIYDYCETQNIPTKRCGKLIIATDALETYRLNVLHRRGVENRIPGLTMLKHWKEIHEIQPNCKGLQALWSPNTGNINWKIVAKQFAKDFQSGKGQIFLNTEVKSVRESASSSHPVLIEVKNDFFLAKYAVLCLGLHSGTLFDSDKEDEHKNISLRVNYQTLTPKLIKYIKTNIYALPNMDMPFIGVHISPMVDGSVLLGPSAVPALKLDGYKTSQFDFNYVQNHVFSKGFGMLFLKNVPTCLNQVQETVCNDTRQKVLSKYFPMIGKSDILPGPSAVQGQVVTSDGEFVDDFMLEVFRGEGIGKRLINCRFVPSPGATCSLALADLLCENLEKVFV